MKGFSRIAAMFAFSALALIANPRGCLGGSPIYLRGVVEAHCSIVVTALPASSIRPRIAKGLRLVQVGAILQNCNQRTGLTLTAASAVCATVPAEAKAVETMPQRALAYSVDADGPAGRSGAASVVDLVAASCSAAVKSSVAVERSADGTSTLYVNFNMN
jgi:hypothetical protein